MALGFGRETPNLNLTWVLPSTEWALGRDGCQSSVGAGAGGVGAGENDS